MINVEELHMKVVRFLVYHRNLTLCQSCVDVYGWVTLFSQDYMDILQLAVIKNGCVIRFGRYFVRFERRIVTMSSCKVSVFSLVVSCRIVHPQSVEGFEIARVVGISQQSYDSSIYTWIQEFKLLTGQFLMNVIEKKHGETIVYKEFIIFLISWK